MIILITLIRKANIIHPRCTFKTIWRITNKSSINIEACRCWSCRNGEIGKITQFKSRLCDAVFLNLHLLFLKFIIIQKSLNMMLPNDNIL